MTINALLQRFVADELALAPALIGRVGAGTVQLLGPSKDGGAASERSHHAEIVMVLQRDHALYQRTFVESLRRLVDEELSGIDAAVGAAPSAPGSLELMDESRVDVDIEISRAMQLIDTTAEWELRELQTFTSTLVGQRHVTSESNPFRPLVYATALWEAACAIATTQADRMITLRTSAGVAAGLLKSAWAAASTRLESQGVEPGAYRTVVLPSGASFGRTGAEAAPAGSLGSLLPSMPQPSMGAPSEKRATDAASELFSAQEQQRDSLLATVRDPVDRQVIELVMRLFEALLADSGLANGFRAVLSRMQMAILRSALADKALLDSYEHPVWQLLDRIGDVSLGYPRSDDPRLMGFLAFSGALADEVAGASVPDAALFRRTLNRIDAFLAEQLQGQLRAAQTSVTSMQLAERREALQQNLTKRLSDLMTTVRTSPTIRRFVTGTWAQVIADAMLRDGEQSEATLSDLKTVDDLLWSLKIPDHPQSRRRLIALLPGLLQRLRAGMETISLPAAEQQAVLGELMAVHTEALRPGGRPQVAGALTPEQIVQGMRDEVLADAPAARGFGDSVIDLSSMETVPAEHLPTGGDRDDDDPARRVESLRVGERRRIFLHGRWNRVQLLWRSDRSLFFLFAGESPTPSHSITRRALERLSSAALLQPLAGKSLVQRAVDRMMRNVPARD